MHPEYVRHLSAGSACFKKCPVVIPVNDINFDLDAGFFRPLVCNLLQACELIVIPDVDLKFT